MVKYVEQIISEINNRTLNNDHNINGEEFERWLMNKGEENSMEKKQWIITKTNSETPEVVFYKFVGTVNELKCKILHMAQSCSAAEELLENNDEGYPDSIEYIEFDEDNQTAFIDVTSYDEEYDEVFTAKALAAIDFVLLEEV